MIHLTKLTFYIEHIEFVVPSTVRGFSGEKRGMKNKVCIGR